MGYSRGSASRPPDALLDAWLLGRFPGRTLEELDGMDWGRFSRALEAGQIERVLQRETLWKAGKLETLDESDWQVIKSLPASPEK